MNITDYLCSMLDDKYFLDEVLILGPYPSAKFIEKFFGEDYPKRTPTTGPEITLIIDDGWDQQRIEEIENSIPKGRGIRQPQTTIHRVAPSNPRGLVHAKLYYFKVSNRDKNYTKRFLLVGSANASEMGFGVHAETYINIDLADIKGKDELTAIELYIKSLKAKESIVEPCKFSLGRNTWVQLPAVNFVEDQKSGFDAWLRRGRLCHKYQSDQNFGKIKLHLKKPLPTSIFEQVLKSSRFGQEQNSSVLSRSYINEIVDEGNDSDPLWRSKFFVDTYYGQWTSGECYAFRQAEFCSPQSRKRKEMLRLIESGNQQETWLLDFMKGLEQVVQNAKEDAHNYMELSRDGKVSSDYSEKANNKIDADQKRARDAGFAERFKSGYSFVRFPQLGDDFEEFAVNFCQTLLLQIESRSVKNQLALVLREQLDNNLPDSAVSLLAILRENWPNWRKHLIDYYKDKN